MKTLLDRFLICGLVSSAIVFVTASCDDDDNPGPQLTGENKQYTLSSVSDPAINGTVTFAERDDDQILITIQLNGTSSGTHPAHIHVNSAAAGGSIVLDLEDVDGTDGKSETVISALNDGTAITYEQLLDFNGHVNVHLDANNLPTLLAQGDIGANELTGERKEYEMTPVENPAVQGKAIFEKRKKGTTLVTIMLEGQEPGLTHASHFHSNTVADTGPIVINLKSINSSNSITKTSVDTLNNGNPVTYEELLNFNGYINVHKGATFVAQVDIGQNELTGEHQHYTLNAVGASGVSGMATFEKRKNGKTQVTLQLDGTTAGDSHPAHIHTGNVTTGGPIAIDLKNVVGATGMSLTNVTQNRDGAEVSYDELVDFDGHINVHLSATELSTIIAQGDIGGNVQ